MIGATRSTPRAFATSLAGRRPNRLHREFDAPSSGISTTTRGSLLSRAARITSGSRCNTRLPRDANVGKASKGNHSRRRIGNATLSGHAGRVEAAAARVRQADDLLSAVDADA